MNYQNLSDTVSIKTVSENDKEGLFEIEGLYTGYGVTLGNSLRRVMLSSLPGAAITQFKIKGASHEFATIPGVVEDLVELSLNLKRIRFRIHTAEPQVLTLRFKGEGVVSAKEIETNSEVELLTPEVYIATVSEKNADLEMELTIETGLGYVPAEARKAEKLAIGVIALDAIFSPVQKVNFSVENMRVGDRTNYNRLKLFIETDKSITPSQALSKAVKILEEYFAKVSEIKVQEPTAGVPGESASKKESKSNPPAGGQKSKRRAPNKT